MKPAVQIFFLLVLLSSCTVNNFYGLYGTCDNGYLACNQLLINDDSTYTYYEFWDVGGVHNIIEGSWRKNQDTLFLTSSPASDACNMEVEELIVDSVKLHRIHINDIKEGDMPFGQVEIFFGGESLVGKTNFEGNADFVIYSHSIDSIKITSPYIDACSLTFYVQESKSNYFQVNHTYRHIGITMQNEPWLIKKDKVYFDLDSTGRFDKQIFKTKTTLDQKVW